MIANDVDVPTHLEVHAPDGALRARVNLVGVVPPRTLVTADPILVSGLSITRTGDVYFTTIDQGATYQVTRLVRWSGGAGLDEVATDLGPGACVSPDGRTYYYLPVDGDRWSLAALDLATGARRPVLAMPAGQYVLAAQPSPDGTKLVASVWDGRFSLWIVDAATGAIAQRIEGAGDTPVYDGAFVDDTHVVYLAEVDGRFQAAVRDLATGATAIATDAPYAVLDARAAGGTLRFLSRDGWQWNVDEVPLADARAIDVTAPAPVASPATAEPHVLADAPYHAYDHLFAPTLHTLAFFAPASNVALIGAALSGSDRLGYQRWALVGYVEPDTRELSGQASYGNAMLAPWIAQASISEVHWTETDQDGAGNDVRVHRRERDATLSFGRTWRGSWSASLLGLSTEIHDRATGFAPSDLRLVGPGLALAYSGFDSTAYAGAYRGAALSFDGAWYPAELAQPAAAITDLRGELDLAAPVPGLRRPTLHASAVGRALDSTARGLLQLGGVAALPAVFTRSTDRALPDYAGPDLPPLVRFEEPLRGYEDFPITTDRAAIAELRARVPLIVDRGWATTLYAFPATFVRQLDLELFAAGAIDETMGARAEHAAAGAAITLRAMIMRVPLLVTYQAARRLRDDDAWTQLVGIGPGF
jgi:hypothetical protein